MKSAISIEKYPLSHTKTNFLWSHDERLSMWSISIFFSSFLYFPVSVSTVNPFMTS